MYIPEIALGFVIGAVVAISFLIVIVLVYDKHDKKNKK